MIYLLVFLQLPAVLPQKLGFIEIARGIRLDILFPITGDRIRVFVVSVLLPLQHPVPEDRDLPLRNRSRPRAPQRPEVDRVLVWKNRDKLA